MVESDIITVRFAGLRTGLDGLLLNGAHTVDFQLGAECGGDILQHQADGVIQPCGGKQEAQKIQEGKLPADQQPRSGEDGCGQTDAQERLSGAHEYAGGSSE